MATKLSNTLAVLGMSLLVGAGVLHAQNPGRSAPADAPRAGQAVSRGSDGPSGGGGATATGTPADVQSGGSTGSSAPTRGRQDASPRSGGARGRTRTNEPTAARPRDNEGSGAPGRGEAVRRPRGDRQGDGGSVVVVTTGPYGGYYPWAYGGSGLGGYYGGYWDPAWDEGTLDYGLTHVEGRMRLKVKPRDASVFVDGYFAGQVDDFDGFFQRLHLEAGPHRVEVMADGYEPLLVEVRIEPNRTITYTGTLDVAR